MLSSKRNDSQSIGQTTSRQNLSSGLVIRQRETGRFAFFFFFCGVKDDDSAFTVTKIIFALFFFQQFSLVTCVTFLSFSLSFVQQILLLKEIQGYR